MKFNRTERFRLYPLVVLALASLITALAACKRQSEQNPPAVTGPVAGSELVAVVDDSIITTKVKAALLADPVVKGITVGVTTSKGAVTLDGMVGTQSQIDQAQKVATGIEGVKSVVNKMTLKP